LASQKQEQPESQEGGVVKCQNSPTWAAYNSLLSAEKPLTEVSVLPLIAAAAYEWQTLVNVLKHTEQIKVITLDMALYERAKQPEMTRDDCKGKWLMRLGEMYTVMAALRAVGMPYKTVGLMRHGAKLTSMANHNKADP